MLYSRSTRGFYIPELHGKNIPPDAEELTQEEYGAMLDAQAVLSDADRSASARAKIIAELQKIDASGARAARGIALALVAGTEPSAADVDTIKSLELQAVGLRATLAELETA